MSIETRQSSLRLNREIEGHAAILLPYEENGSISETAYRNALIRTDEAGLGCAVNMDTGYANYLCDDERKLILSWTKETLNNSFIAGVFVEGMPGDLFDNYARQMHMIAEHGGIPILFQTSAFHAWEPDRIVDFYASLCAQFESVLGFELGQMFAPNGMIFDETVIRGLMQIPSLKGIKHSSLCRTTELKRLELRDLIRPDFKIYTGNDLGIDMIEYGSDYLLGLAAFCPEKFAERDTYWKNSDSKYYELSDALQHLGNVAFRSPVPAYKHSCAVFQHSIGRIPSPRAHPKCPQRPDWEAQILADCAARLGYLGNQT